MINTATVKKLIEENRLDKLPAAIETANDDGMLNFNQALFQLVKDGKVSEQEALSKASNPQALEMNFKGIFLDEGSYDFGPSNHGSASSRLPANASSSNTP